MMLKQRLCSSFFLWGILLACLLIFKSFAVYLFIFVLTLSAISELAKLFKMEKKIQYFNFYFASLFLLGYVINSHYFYLSQESFYTVTFAFLFNWIVFCGKTIRALGFSLFCFWYIPLNLHFLFKLSELFQNQITFISVTIWFVLVTKLTDVGGFFVGCAYGRNRLAPLVSPKKSWEGVGGGILFALLGGLLFQLLFSSYLPEGFTLSKNLLFVLILAWGSVISDLLESLIKRGLNTKDSGNTFPGIGGILDLIDSLLLNIPLAYVLFKNFVL